VPVTRWDWKNSALGGGQVADKHALLAEVGSLSLEFTRLSQLTADPKWYDAIARITDVFEDQQNKTRIPGLWPVYLNVQNNDFQRDITFTLGGMADSVYEYLPKQHLMIGGQSEQYRSMYQTALKSAKQNIFFRPFNPSNTSMLIAGTVKRHSSRNRKLIPQGQHLTCFAGGMVALASKIFSQPHEMRTARELLDGCLWGYDSMNSGIGPEIFTAMTCDRNAEEDDCIWSDERWYAEVARHANGGGESTSLTAQAQNVIAAGRLAPGIVAVDDARYILRPEAIESLFVLYRITGDKSLQDRAWQMFQAIISATRTSIAYASVNDVTFEEPELFNSMESFWTAETLKYFYLIFAEPDVVSLDKYVLNTEAHPLLRPVN
jgi:mannosyl-oligosaccharide alpha-1,2-mannosidase